MLLFLLLLYCHYIGFVFFSPSPNPQNLLQLQQKFWAGTAKLKWLTAGWAWSRLLQPILLQLLRFCQMLDDSGDENVCKWIFTHKRNFGVHFNLDSQQQQRQRWRFTAENMNYRGVYTQKIIALYLWTYNQRNFSLVVKEILDPTNYEPQS